MPETQEQRSTVQQKIRFLAQLQMRLGERKIDVVIEHATDTRLIVEVAYAIGVEIK
jgi:hypothetical protein